MVEVVTALRLAAGALGALGGSLLFVEFFQLPSYVTYDPEYNAYDLDVTPSDAREYTWAGRIGALLVAVAFALQFLATFLG